MKLGILGGTFDPVHNGHLALAEAAARRAALDRVLLVPCARPPHKDRTGLTDGYQRYAMLALAADGLPGLAVSPLELIRGGISFTADTLGEISAERPEADLFLLVGSDSFVEMETWRDLDRILALAAVLVLHRPGERARDPVDGAPAALKGRVLAPGEALPAPARPALPLAALVGGAPVEISSTDIRQRAREGRSISGLVPASVEAYIRRQELYGATTHG